MVKNYFKIYFRLISANRWTYIINILGLSSGFAAFILLLLYLNHELSYDKFHKDSHRTYRIVSELNTGDKLLSVGLSRLSQGPYAKESNSNIESYCRLRSSMVKEKIILDELIFMERGFSVDSNFFSFFDYPLLTGIPSTVLREAKSIVISKRLKDIVFGDKNPIGQIIEMEGVSLKVSGIMKDMPKNSHIQADFLIPMHLFFSNKNNQDLGGISFTTYLKFFKNHNSTAHIQSVITQLDKESRNSEQYSDLNLNTRLQVLEDVHLKSADLSYNMLMQKKGDPKYLWMFFFLAILIILIAVINFINLTTAYGEERGRESGIRKVLGGSKQSLIYQYLSESIFSSLISLVLALGIVSLLLHPFEALMDRDLSFSFFDQWYLIPIFIFSTVILGVLSGLYPAFFISNFSIIKCLKGGVSEPKNRNLLQKILVVLQFSMAYFLIICLSVIVLQLNYIKKKDLGFQKENVIIFDKLTYNQEKKNAEIIQSIKALPSVDDAFATENYPGDLKDLNYVQKEHNRQSLKFPAHESRVSKNYFSFFGMSFLEGHGFLDDLHKKENSDEVIINSTLAKSLGIDPPYTGKKFYHMGEKVSIVGVVPDFNFQSLHKPIEPLMFFQKSAFDKIIVRIKGNDNKNAIRSIEKILSEYDSKYFPSHIFMEQQIEAFYKEEERRNKLVFVSSILGLLISVLGLFALTTFTLQRKRKETAIRLVLGGRPKEIVIRLITDLLKWVLVADIIAFPFAYLIMVDWLNNYAYKISISPWIFIFSALFTSIVAMLTVFGQTHRLSKQNPVDVLRTEG
ncbi:MAG: ABC transporter permease [Bacteroidales bacterium]